MFCSIRLKSRPNTASIARNCGLERNLPPDALGGVQFYNLDGRIPSPLGEMPMKSIRELLTGAKPISVAASSNVLEAAELMKKSRVGALLISDAKTGSLGVFSERDLMTRVVVPRLDPEKTSVRSVMTSNVFTASPEGRVNDLAMEMQERHIRHLPIVEDGVVVAMLSLRDLLRAHLQVKRREVRELTSYIQGEG